jgi:hypothetical protein
MSVIKNHSNRDLSKFDTMSTESLNEILRQDSQMPNDENSDMDAIQYILEVIAKREKKDPKLDFTDVDVAWNRFNENYRSSFGDRQSLDDQSLYDFNEENQMPLQDRKPISFTKENRSHRHGRRNLLRFVSVAAVLIFVVFAGSFTVYALGFDLWGAVAQWTKEIFGFTTVSDSDNNIQSTNLLGEYGISEKLIPTWLPDGYQFDSSDVAQTPKRTTFLLKYVSEESEILITITMLSEPAMSIYEKDGAPIVEYETEGIVHYIMDNNGVANIVWVKENYECSITGNFNVADAKKMIKSIYRSN